MARARNIKSSFFDNEILGEKVRILELSDVPKVYQGLPGVITAVEKDFYIVMTEAGELACPKDYVQLDLTKLVFRSD